jgi:S1-C subfamily serine protease
MKLLRPVAIAVLLVGSFFYYTTYRSGAFRTVNSPAAKVEITEASGNGPLGQEEQNNISVYQKNVRSVVNVTSKAVAFDFFYGLVPQEGQGSGFIIDGVGHVLTNYHVIADARQVEVTLHNRTIWQSYKSKPPTLQR